MVFLSALLLRNAATQLPTGSWVHKMVVAVGNTIRSTKCNNYYTWLKRMAFPTTTAIWYPYRSSARDPHKQQPKVMTTTSAKWSYSYQHHKLLYCGQTTVLGQFHIWVNLNSLLTTNTCNGWPSGGACTSWPCTHDYPSLSMSQALRKMWGGESVHIVTTARKLACQFLVRHHSCGKQKTLSLWW